ncbi:hypothetical protein NC651_038449 [Populus alba x Populus x berolinensis]|nr:hypothetical protein NC651_038449 [Populus alba x Populus x berolinensis]
MAFLVARGGEKVTAGSAGLWLVLLVRRKRGVTCGRDGGNPFTAAGLSLLMGHAIVVGGLLQWRPWYATGAEDDVVAMAGACSQWLRSCDYW